MAVLAVTDRLTGSQAGRRYTRAKYWWDK
jgi:hypothetical protein